MKRFALFGHPVGHSLSPKMHTASFRAIGLDATYEAFDVPPEKLAEELEKAFRLAYVNGDKILPYFTEEEKDFKTNFSRFITPRNILNIYNLTQKSMVEIMRNGNAKMIFLTLAINIGKLIKNTPNK